MVDDMSMPREQGARALPRPRPSPKGPRAPKPTKRTPGLPAGPRRVPPLKPVPGWPKFPVPVGPPGGRPPSFPGRKIPFPKFPLVPRFPVPVDPDFWFPPQPGTPPSWKLPVPYPNPANGWRLDNGPCYRNGAPDTSSTLNLIASLNPCLGGQAVGGPGGALTGIIPPNPTKTTYGLWKWNGSVSLARYAHIVSYVRSYAAAAKQLQSEPQLNPYTYPGAGRPMRNPNWMRGQPGQLPVPNPLEHPANPPGQNVPGLPGGAPFTGGNPFTFPRLPTNVVVQPIPTGATIEVMPPGVQPPKVNVPPHVRAKPPKGTKEGKMRGPLFFFFMIADAISEWAEVADAMFEALPEDVQRRWSKGRPKRKLLDNAGQYGVDGADWKLQAVWHNFHKVDPVDFFRNLIANQVEDKLIGSLHKHMPRNMINTAQDGQRAYAELVQGVLVELGLKDPPK